MQSVPDLAALVSGLDLWSLCKCGRHGSAGSNGITQMETALKLSSDIGIVTLLSVLCLIILPAALAGTAAACSSAIAGNR